MSAKKGFVQRLKQPTTWIIVVFILLFLWGLRREAEASDLRFEVGLGFGSTHQSTVVMEELGLLYDEKWYVHIAHLGNDERVPDTYRITAGRRVAWRQEHTFSPYLRMGAAYWQHRPAGLVDANLTFDMAVGLRAWDVVELEWSHQSTAGRVHPNTGVDVVGLHYTSRF